MSERFTKQAEEILAICQRLKVQPSDLGDMVGIKPETMRKYAKGYQKASDFAMQGIRNAEKLTGILRGAPPRPKPDSSSPHSWMETPTLERALADLTGRLTKAAPADRKFVLSNIRDMLDELEHREVSSKPLTEAQQIAKRAGDKWDREHSST